MRLGILYLQLDIHRMDIFRTVQKNGSGNGCVLYTYSRLKAMRLTTAVLDQAPEEILESIRPQ